MAGRGNGGFPMQCRTLSDNTISPCKFSLLSLVPVVSISIVEFTPGSSHERPSVDLVRRNDLRNLSTNRKWNLFKLLWLPSVAFGGLVPVLFVGLVTKEVCDVREEFLENWGLEANRFIAIGALRCAGDVPKKWLSGEDDKLGASEREHSDTLRDLQPGFEHSDVFRERLL